MHPFVRLNSIAAPLPLENVDTDKILAGRFLKTITREGLGDKLFWSLRQDPNFILNRAPWNQSEILVALDNFGCGSSREHAQWALLDFGIRCVIAPSIADIFYSNCFKNGILPIILPRDSVLRLLEVVGRPEGGRLAIDLPEQRVTVQDGTVFAFEIDAQRKADLIAGIDEIDRTLGFREDIRSYEVRHKRKSPWIIDVDEDVLLRSEG